MTQSEVLFKLPSWWCLMYMRKQCSLGTLLKNASSMFSPHVNAHVTERMKLSNVGASLCPAKGKKKGKRESEGNKAPKQQHSATKWFS